MAEQSSCPTCGAAWAREEYQPVERLIVTCANGHRFLVRELRSGGRYVGLKPIDGEDRSA